MSDKNLLQLLFTEAEVYSSIDSIEQYLQEGMDLVHHPIQPLYVGLKSLAPEVAAQYLDRFSPEQRKIFMDIDLWQRDNIAPTDFGYWLKAYEHCQDDEIRYSFIKSNEFLLWLKSRVNIWTFDVEDPLYPDHDNYFLTDDNLLLIEFDETFEFVHEVRRFIRELYSIWGVERAYAHLFKMVSSSYAIIEEEEYQEKKNLQSDYGFVDYYDALQLTSTYGQKSLLDNFIRRHVPATGEVDNVAQEQIVHSNALIAYKKGMESIYEELNKLGDEKRTRFLNFDFIRLVNATLTLDEALKAGPVAMARVGRRARCFMLLGLDYVRSISDELPEEGIFSRFTFSDLHKVGASLVRIIQKKINSGLNKFQYNDSKESFLGRFWNEFLLASFDDVPKFLDNVSEKPEEVLTADSYTLWEKHTDLFVAVLPFINGLRKTFDEMKESGKISDEFYLNYTIDEIDFEAVILSNYANFLLGHFDQENHVPRLGISVDEFKRFIGLTLSNGSLVDQSLNFESFRDRFGLDSIEGFDLYMTKLLKEHLEGYEYDKLSDDDFAHIGGPILLTNIKH